VGDVSIDGPPVHVNVINSMDLLDEVLDAQDVICVRVGLKNRKDTKDVSLLRQHRIPPLHIVPILVMASWYNKNEKGARKI
jgi:hypothetical protein